VTITVPAIWKVGDVILDQYEVTEELGKGGMGTVYKVHHRGWNVNLAVKSPQPQFLAAANGMEQFIREAETWVNLPLHPHIVSCYYVRILGGIPRIFAEYVAGGSLLDWIRQRRLYEGGREQALERILDVAIQFAWGLHAAHLQGLVHQDVKPGNVMLTVDGVAKVSDFGSAKARAMVEDGGQSMLVSHAGAMSGAYCSPEQAARHSLSRKTDIWSWGVSILDMFIARKKRLGPLAGEALVDFQRRPREIADSAIPEMPHELADLLFLCFQPLPNNRPATMLEIAEVLQKIYADRVGQPYPREIPQPARMLADSLNNRALSLLDLGKVEEARQVWEEALHIDPHHLYAAYNHGIVLWRRGELRDNQLIQQLKEIRAAQDGYWQATYLLAQIHLEQGDVDTALELLQEVVKLAPDEIEVQNLLEQLQLGELPLGRCLHTFNGHMESVTSVSLSADGHFALSGSWDKTVRLWEVSTGHCLRIFRGHTRAVCSVSLSSDGRFALSGDLNNTVRVWEVATGRCLHSWRHEPKEQLSQIESVSLSADGHLALSGGWDYAAQLWEVSTRRCLYIFQDTSPVYLVSLSADGRLALTTSLSGARLWEVATGRCLHAFQDKRKPASLSADGRLLLFAEGDLQLWDVATGQFLRTLQWQTEYGSDSVSLSTDGHFALSSKGNTVWAWEVATGRCLRIFRGHTGTIRSIDLSADGRLGLSGSADGTLRLWEIPHERFLCSLRLAQVWSYTNVSRIETRAEVLLQQAEYELKEAHFAQALDLVRQARMLPGWERSPRCLQMWEKLLPYCAKVDFRTAWMAKTFEGHTSGVSAVSLSADDRWFLSGSGDRTVRLWEVATGRCLRVFRGHTKYIFAVSLSTDCHRAFSWSEDNTVRVWEVATGRCLRTFDAAAALGLIGKCGMSQSVDGLLVMGGGG
jgi:WD40 repeat protein/serine/threonine protein kinase